MTYAWNPLWEDVVPPGNQEYTETVRRMVMASINWIAEHPTAVPEWAERRITPPPGVAPNEMMIIGAWEDYFHPDNAHARRWFKVIAGACKDGASVFMMQKAVACGCLFKNEGWEEFDAFMLKGSGQATKQ